MSRILIISDIHGNQAALNALLRAVREDSIDAVRCLGDIVGYYGRPSQTLRAVAQRDPDFRIGNHEIAATYETCGDDLHLSKRAILGAMRHRKHLMRDGHLEALKHAAEDSARLDTRHEVLDGLSLSFVHGTPAADQPLRKVCSPYVRPKRASSADEQDWSALSAHFSEAAALNGAGLSLYFIGHSHSSFLAQFAGEQVRLSSVRYNEPVGLNAEQGIVLINVGSVGQPRDNVPLQNGNKRAHGVLLDTAERTVTFVAADYVVAFGRMYDELESDSFSQDMPDDLILETYNALATRGLMPQRFSDPRAQLNAIRRQLDELWQKEVDGLIETLDHPRISNIAEWWLTYDYYGFSA
jgi:predicted phosphodiesterase